MFFSNLKIPATYHLINTIQKLDWLIGELEKSPISGYDIETNFPTAKIKIEQGYPEKVAGISFAWGRDHFENPWTPGNAAYVPLIKVDDSDYWKTKQGDVVAKLKSFLESESYKVAQNGKFDSSKLCLLLDIQTRGFKFDTLLAHSLIDEDRAVSSHALKSDFDEEGNITKLGMGDAYIDTESSQFKDDLKSALAYYDPHYKRYSKVPIDVLFSYACADADLTLALKFVFDKMLEDEGLTWVFENIVMPLSHHIMLLEMAGMPLDIPRAKQIVVEQLAIMGEAQKEVWAAAGKEFNVGSNEQLGDFLFDSLKLPGQKGDHNKWKVDLDALSSLNHPIVQPILKYRRAQKIQATYAQSSLDLVRDISEDGRIGRICPTYWLDTKTGRQRCESPNLTNLPKPENGGDIVKSMYVAPDGYKFIFKDFSQIELRMAAHLSGEPAWRTSFFNNEDLHSRTAHSIYKLDCALEDVKELYKEKRSAAKTINFGILYGESIYSLSEALSISYEEAEHLINVEYFGAAPVLKAWIDSIHEFVKSYGYVTTMFGRRRHLPEAMLSIPPAMKWPDDSVRPQCYRNGPFASFLGIDPADWYNLSEFDVKQLIKAKGSMNQFSHCLSCNYVLSCGTNRERKYVISKVNGALRQAVNSPIQGSSSEFTSLALINMSQEFINEGMLSSPRVVIHDEIGVLAPDSEVEKACKIMDFYMVENLAQFTQFSVPLLVDTAIVSRWSEK